jgi:hypothetical protein
MSYRYFVQFKDESLEETIGSYSSWYDGELTEEKCKTAKHDYDKDVCTIIPISQWDFDAIYEEYIS